MRRIVSYFMRVKRYNTMARSMIDVRARRVVPNEAFDLQLIVSLADHRANVSHICITNIPLRRAERGTYEVRSAMLLTMHFCSATPEENQRPDAMSGRAISA